MRICVIIPAAGGSKRYNEASAELLGEPRSKLDEDLGGRPLLQRTVELFTSREDVASVVVAGPHDASGFEMFSMRHGDRLSLLGVTLCRGGAEHRWQSVRAALEYAPDDATHIAVHDAARPVADEALIERVFEAASRHPAVIPAVEASDTLKRVSAEPIAEAAEADPLAGILVDSITKPLRAVEETIDRTNLVAVQTPQIFEADLLRRAYEQADLESTDDAGLIERLGERVVVVEGDPLNVKVTRPRDLPLVRAIGGFRLPKERPTHKKF